LEQVAALMLLRTMVETPPRLYINRQQENVLRNFDEIVGSLSCYENLDIVFQVSMFFSRIFLQEVHQW
jgi:hypothetical protein